MTPPYEPPAPRAREHAVEAVPARVADAVAEVVHDLVAEVRPRMRGWLHAATAPLSLVAGVLLVVLSPPGLARNGSAVFAVCALTLFSVSAAMHANRWSPRTQMLLTRLDHASIFLLIAGTYTPVSLLLLEGADRVALLAVAWSGALVGISFRVFRPDASRWVFTPIYIALGWAAIFFLGDFLRYETPAVLVLIAVGGVAYTAGGVVYGLRRPNPFPQWFGFHEVFHFLTVVAFAAHYTGVSIAAYSLR